MEDMNFSWVIPNQLAGCRGPTGISDLEYLKKKGISLLVRLVEKDKAQVSPQEVTRAGLIDLPEPVRDYHAPTDRQTDKIVTAVEDEMRKEHRVAVSCGMGIGRTGTVLAMILINLCDTFYTATKKVAETRNQSHAWEHERQRQAIIDYAERIGKV